MWAECVVDARRRVRTQINPDKLLDVDSLQELLLDLLVLSSCTACTCTCTCRLGRQTGRTHSSLPKHARRFASATVEFQAGVRSTDDVQTWTFTASSISLLACIFPYLSEKKHTNQLPPLLSSLKHFEAVN